MKLSRILLALLLALLGGGTCFMGGLLYHTRKTSPPQLSPLAILLFAAFFVLIGGYLLVFAFRLCRLRGPLMDPQEAGRERKSRIYSAVMMIVAASSLAATHGGGAVSFAGYFAALIAAFYFGNYVLIGLHEIGHCLGGILVGARPRFLQVGVGKGLFCFHFRGFQVRIGRLPSAGFAGCDPKRGTWQRWEYLIMVIAGPLMSLATAFGLYFAIRAASLPFSLTQNTIWETGLVLFFFQSLLFVLSFFWMGDVTINNYILKPDLRQILICLFSKEMDWANLLVPKRVMPNEDPVTSASR